MGGGGGGGGGFAHADDIRTLTNSTSSLNAQLEAVSSFTTENFLQLNLSECEIVSFSRESNCAQPQVSLDGATLQCKDVAKCLGYVWNSTLSSKPMSLGRLEYFVLMSSSSVSVRSKYGASSSHS